MKLGKDILAKETNDIAIGNSGGASLEYSKENVVKRLSLNDIGGHDQRMFHSK